MEKSFTRVSNKAIKGDKLKDSSWNCDKNQGSLCGFPWLPRSYTCSFCKREFRSAQALGGHMNVHRRERARLLRHSSPSFLNPNPNFSSSSSPCYGPLSSRGSVSTYMNGAKPCFGIKEFNYYDCGDTFMKNSKLKMMTEIVISDSDEDLDLELRLGCS